MTGVQTCALPICHQAIQQKLQEKLEEQQRLERDPSKREPDAKDAAPKKLEPPTGGLPEAPVSGGTGAALKALPGGVPGVPGVGVTAVPIPPVPIPTPDLPLPSLPGGGEAPGPKAVPAAPPPSSESQGSSAAKVTPADAAPAASTLKPEAGPARPQTDDRGKALNERRRRQLEDPKAQYERDRQIQSDRDLSQGRDADRDAQRRRREQR